MKFLVRSLLLCLIPVTVWLYLAIKDLGSPDSQRLHGKVFSKFLGFQISADETDVEIGPLGVEVEMKMNPDDVDVILDKLRYPQGRQLTLLESQPLMHNPHYCFTSAYHSPYDQNFEESDNIDYSRKHGSFSPQSGWIPLDDKIVNNTTQKIHWVFYVHTSIMNYQKRQIIRKTWGFPRLFKDYNMRILFVVGRPETASRQKMLELEYSVYGDILQGDFLDTYQNITYKAIFTMRWLLTYCSHVPIVMKADDDAFVNIFHMKELLVRYSNFQPSADSEKSKTDSESRSSFEPRNTLICNLYDNYSAPILRAGTNCQKWCLGKYDMPGMTHYPAYCAGLLYFFTMPLVKRLYESVKTTPFLWIDDIYVTGLLPMSVEDINYVTLYNKFTLSSFAITREYRDLSKPFKHDVAHVKDTGRFAIIWNLLLRRLSQRHLDELTLRPEKLRLNLFERFIYLRSAHSHCYYPRSSCKHLFNITKSIL